MVWSHRSSPVVRSRKADGPRKEAAGVAARVGLLYGLAGLGSSGVAVALPALAEQFAVSTGVATWVISLYTVVLAVGMAVFGRLTDLFGVDRLLLVGVPLMALGAAGAALSPTLEVLLLSRVLQGAGASSVLILGVAIINSRYMADVRASALGKVAGVGAAVSSLGPITGGGLEEVLGWRAAVAVPALSILALPRLLRVAPTAVRNGDMDLLGAVVLSTVACALVLLVQSPSSGPLIALCATSVLIVGVPALCLHVRRRPDGFLPMAVVKDPGVLLSAVAASGVPAAWFALLIAVPVVLVGDGWSPFSVGVVLLPSAVSALLAPKLAAPLARRLGGRRALLIAGLLATVALVTASVGARMASPTFLTTAVVIVTFAFGLGQPALVATVGDNAPPDIAGIALGIATLIFMLGGGLGSAIVGGVSGLLPIATVLLLVAMFPLAGIVALGVAPLNGPGKSVDRALGQ